MGVRREGKTQRERRKSNIEAGYSPIFSLGETR